MYKYEKPYHHVEIKMPFYMQTTQVTHGQWNYIMGTEIADYNWKYYIGTEISDYNNKADDYPIFHISWHEVQEFIERLNRMEHTDRYRLPSEAEWEYACRAESDTAFCFGDNAKGLGKFAWYCDNSSKKPHPVGKKKPNKFVLYDMHGNVCEWVEDDWHENYIGAPDNGHAWIDKPRTAFRVLRGGSRTYPARFCRSAFRECFWPEECHFCIGFRLCRSVS